MEKKRVVPIWVSAVLLVVLVAGVVYGAINLAISISSSGLGHRNILYIPSICSAILAMIYCLMGYKKKGKGVFKAYCVAATITQIVTLYGLTPVMSAENMVATVLFFVHIIICGNWFVLTIAKDLGKKYTYWLCGINLGCAVAEIIIYLCSGYTKMALQISPFVFELIIAFIMFYAKYQDKAARGTK